MGCGVRNVVFEVWGMGYGEWGVGCGVWELECGVWGVGCGIYGLMAKGCDRQRALGSPSPGTGSQVLGVGLELVWRWGYGVMG